MNRFVKRCLPWLLCRPMTSTVQPCSIS
jgi:hypothetical protein